MIRDGATMIRGADDLLDDLGVDRELPPRAPDLDGSEERVWNALAGRLLADAVARRARMSVSDAITTLVRLELRGLVASSGGRFERRHRATVQVTGADPSPLTVGPPADTG